MQLHHYESASGNFGDDLNLWLWDAILPGWRGMWPDRVLVGVGTLINDRLPAGEKVVLGAGVGYGALPDAAMLAECRILALRGPRSAKALGQPAARAIVDPAVLIADLPEFADIPRNGRPVFVPHHACVRRLDWARLCDRAGIDYVSPEGEARAVIRRLAGAPLVIAESMHAAILADAFGTPWHAVSISHRFNDWKWRDWSESLGLEARIRPLFPLTQAIAARLPRSAPVATVSGQTSSRPHKPSARHRLRLAIEATQAVPHLRALARQTGQLSDRAALADAKRRYRAVLAEVAEGRI